MPKLTTLHEAVTRSAVERQRVPADVAHVCGTKVHADLAKRASTILGHHGTTVNAYLGACLALLVEDYENAAKT